MNKMTGIAGDPIIKITPADPVSSSYTPMNQSGTAPDGYLPVSEPMVTTSDRNTLIMNTTINNTVLDKSSWDRLNWLTRQGTADEECNLHCERNIVTELFLKRETI